MSRIGNLRNLFRRSQGRRFLGLDERSFISNLTEEQEHDLILFLRTL